MSHLTDKKIVPKNRLHTMRILLNDSNFLAYMHDIRLINIFVYCNILQLYQVNAK